MTKHVAFDRSGVVCGKPLPFSVFDPARKLLLATRGQVVTERMRAALLRNGLVAIDEDSGQQGQREPSEERSVSPLHQLRQQYARASAISRSGFRMSRDDRSENYSCQVIGIGERRSLILSAPARDDRSYVAISEGQTWLFRTFYATAAIRFSGTVEKLVFEPFPYFHVEVPQIVEMRHVRKMQRVAVSMDAVINLENPQEAVIVDMSTTGMRLALPQDVKLEEGQRIKVDFRVQVLGEVHPLSVNATVVRCLGGADHMHPEVHFYGLGLEMASSMERLLLHAYVQGCLVNELDGLSKILAG